jgi:hypothetical protein
LSLFEFPPPKFVPEMAVKLWPVAPAATENVLPEIVLTDDVIELIALVWL